MDMPECMSPAAAGCVSYGCVAQANRTSVHAKRIHRELRIETSPFVSCWLQRLQIFDEVVLLGFGQSKPQMVVVVIDDRAIRREATVVIEPALLAHEEAAERRRPIHAVRRALRLKVID